MRINQIQIVKALFGVERNISYSPIQIQKLLFLIDQELLEKIDGGPFFKFEPYDYGPFDIEIYDILSKLQSKGLIIIQKNQYQPKRIYIGSKKIYTEGEKILEGMSPNVSKHISSLSSWIRELSFFQLVTYIYKKYPDMAIYSVFNYTS